MKNGKLPGYNRIGKRESPGTFLDVPLKRLICKMKQMNLPGHRDQKPSLQPAALHISEL
jgi:hypothetical protein